MWRLRYVALHNVATSIFHLYNKWVSRTGTVPTSVPGQFLGLRIRSRKFRTERIRIIQQEAKKNSENLYFLLFCDLLMTCYLWKNTDVNVPVPTISNKFLESPEKSRIRIQVQIRNTVYPY
jgi:hypothetical protein